MKEIRKLLAGFRRFRKRHYERGDMSFRQLVSAGQSPKVMIIACCDSRVDPAIITDSDPGDLFVVRNVANLVPPCEQGGGYHGTSAALEFAVTFLRVSHVIVMGHARCGGIRALLGNIQFEGDAGRFISPWMSIAGQARRAVAATHATADPDARAAACERAAICVSLANLMTFPFVREAVTAGRVQLHGWYFDLDRGKLLAYDPASGDFK
jgi:carbonic anhydrase